VILGRDSLLGKKSTGSVQFLTIGSVPPHATTIMALLTTTGSVCPGILPVVDILVAWVRGTLKVVVLVVARAPCMHHKYAYFSG
jgi:hypothetical protein